MLRKLKQQVTQAVNSVTPSEVLPRLIFRRCYFYKNHKAIEFPVHTVLNQTVKYGE